MPCDGEGGKDGASDGDDDNAEVGAELLPVVVAVVAVLQPAANSNIRNSASDGILQRIRLMLNMMIYPS